MKKALLVTTICLLLIGIVSVMQDREHDELSEIIAFQPDHFDLLHLIEKIEQISRGTVIEVRYEKMDSMFSMDQTPCVFSVESITENGVIEYQVNPSDLRILSKHKDFSPQIKSEAPLQGLAIHLKDAVIMAQNVTGGRALAAEIEDEDGFLIHTIQLVQDNKVQTITVDPLNGTVFENTDTHEYHKG